MKRRFVFAFVLVLVLLIVIVIAHLLVPKFPFHDLVPKFPFHDLVPKFPFHDLVPKFPFGNAIVPQAPLAERGSPFPSESLGTNGTPSTITSTSTGTEEASEGCTVYVHVVDLAGKPLDNMIPIAAAQPNAFERPVAQGPPTNTDGKSVFVIPANQRLYIRGWDASLMMFTNNYLTVNAEPGTRTDDLQITMVHGASLDAVLLLPDKTPAANTDVAIMMFHPTQGAWWPDKAQTNADGAVHFPSLPPGQFTVKLKTANGATAEIPNVVFPPRDHVKLGPVTLSNQPQ